MSYKLFLSRAAALAIVCWGNVGCGEEQGRRCIEHAECFAKERCERGQCVKDEGRGQVDAAPDHDAATPSSALR